VPEHKVIAGTVPVLAGATLLAAYAPNVFALGLALYLLRLFGQGMMTHIALTATGRWFMASRGRAVSLVVLGHQGGEATLPLAFAGLAALYGFQAGWVAGAIVLLVVALPLGVWAYARERTPAAIAMDRVAQAETRSGTRAKVVTRPAVLGVADAGSGAGIHWDDALFPSGFYDGFARVAGAFVCHRADAAGNCDDERSVGDGRGD